ncbi:MAG: hypothetical protein U9Q30_04265 [Campylobacterota bacterium]|nr:hypothetical protein [Campylobacterota bacterium]
MKIINLIIILSFIVVNSYAKKEFYYNFIGDDLNQISQEEKDKLINAQDELDTIQRYLNMGKPEFALQQLEVFRLNNSVRLLDSKVILLHANILYKTDNKNKILEAENILLKAINSSKVKQDDLLEAYKLLIKIKIKVNKLKEAKYYANIIEESFDNPFSKVYGKVANAQIYIKLREYKKAIKILKRELIETTNLEIATVIADQLYDAYMLNKENDKAYDLIGKVLERNIDYYAGDRYKAMDMVKKLLDDEMPDFAIKILEQLIKNADNPKNIDNFKFILANTYMDLAGKDLEYLLKAKEIYVELIQNKKSSNIYLKDSKIYLDEIIMREGKFESNMIANKYSTNVNMHDKAMMQELLNLIKDNKFEQAIRMKNIYSKIPNKIINRFGYTDIEELYNIINRDMLRYYLTTGQCEELNTILEKAPKGSLLDVTKEDKITNHLFNCMLALPNEKTYNLAKEVFDNSKRAEIYFYLERVAILINNYKDALDYSIKIEDLNDADVLSKEFLYRFLIYGKRGDQKSIEKFFGYARNNAGFIYENRSNPMIIDFYYQYYLYLLKQNEEEDAIDILYKLYNKQIEMNARIYSPFVEIELAKYAKLDDNYEKALEYLKFGLNIKRMKDGKSIDRKIKKNDLARIYYEMAKIYEFLNKQNRYKIMIKRCKAIKNTDSYYKKMCDKL